MDSLTRVLKITRQPTAAAATTEGAEVAERFPADVPCHPLIAAAHRDVKASYAPVRLRATTMLRPFAHLVSSATNARWTRKIHVSVLAEIDRQPDPLPSHLPAQFPAETSLRANSSETARKLLSIAALSSFGKQA